MNAVRLALTLRRNPQLARTHSAWHLHPWCRCSKNPAKRQRHLVRETRTKASRSVALFVLVAVCGWSLLGCGRAGNDAGGRKASDGAAPTDPTSGPTSTVRHDPRGFQAAAGPEADTAFGGEAVPDAVPLLPIVVTSADGSEHELKRLDRIVSLDGGISEVVFALGLGDRVVGRDSSTTFVEASAVPVLTRGHDVSAESVLSLRPDLVLVGDLTGPPEALDKIEAAGVPVVTIDPATSVQSIAPRTRLIGAAIGREDAADRLAGTIERAVDDARPTLSGTERSPRVAFLYLRGTAGVYLLAGPGSGVDSIIEAAGGTNVADALGLDDPFTPLSSEALVVAQPDILLVTTTGLDSVGGTTGLMGIAGVASTPAGAGGRVIAMEDGLLLGFGPRTPEVIASLAAAFLQAMSAT